MESQGGMNPGMAADQNKVNEVMGMIANLPIPLILFSFLFYFLGGYFLVQCSFRSCWCGC